MTVSQTPARLISKETTDQRMTLTVKGSLDAVAVARSCQSFKSFTSNDTQSEGAGNLPESTGHIVLKPDLRPRRALVTRSSH